MALRLLCSFLLILVFPLLFLPAYANEFVVVRVVDGDTLTAVPKKMNVEQAAMGIRLYGIDAPEMRQAGGEESRAALAEWVKPGDVVEITQMKMDRYDRIVALVALDTGQMLNFAQIQNGYARVSERYCKARFCREWQKAEQKARAERRGIWAQE